MFGKKELIGKVETIISEGTEIKGDVSSEKSMRIDGLVDGHILESNGVIIGKTGKITGDVKAEFIVIGGEVSGNVIATDNLELLPTARIYGDIKAQTLSVQEGAIFEGKCTMNAKKEVNKDVDIEKTEKPEKTEKHVK
ncbi:MAG: polymer-forming cytoskeletal protein [Elusimicrobia bacterium]|nr:polymer-forming cytoskeletal protein [Elusimicrobiota bacterium]